MANTPFTLDQHFIVSNPGGNIGGTMPISTTLIFIAILDRIYLVHVDTKILWDLNIISKIIF